LDVAHDLLGVLPRLGEDMDLDGPPDGISNDPGCDDVWEPTELRLYVTKSGVVCQLVVTHGAPARRGVVVEDTDTSLR
jgi:hypothetical protein